MNMTQGDLRLMTWDPKESRWVEQPFTDTLYRLRKWAKANGHKRWKIQSLEWVTVAFKSGDTGGINEQGQ